jgi:hypothetical protein
MPVKINETVFYRCAEACRMAGTNKHTFLRWVREGSFLDVQCRDRRGWRLFTEYDLARLKVEVNQIKITCNYKKQSTR